MPFSCCNSLPVCLQAFLRGILANWLVNIAIWQATASSSIGGKVLILSQT